LGHVARRSARGKGWIIDVDSVFPLMTHLPRRLFFGAETAGMGACPELRSSEAAALTEKTMALLRDLSADGACPYPSAIRESRRREG
jgi:hypothetical protein